MQQRYLTIFLPLIGLALLALIILAPKTTSPNLRANALIPTPTTFAPDHQPPSLLLVTDTDINGRALGADVTLSGSQLVVITNDQQAHEWLAIDSYADSWSKFQPDGRQLLIWHTPNDWEDNAEHTLSVGTFPDPNPQRILTIPAAAQKRILKAFWSPDGRQIGILFANEKYGWNPFFTSSQTVYEIATFDGTQLTVLGTLASDSYDAEAQWTSAGILLETTNHRFLARPGETGLRRLADVSNRDSLSVSDSYLTNVTIDDLPAIQLTDPRDPERLVTLVLPPETFVQQHAVFDDTLIYLTRGPQIVYETDATTTGTIPWKYQDVQTLTQIWRWSPDQTQPEIISQFTDDYSSADFAWDSQTGSLYVLDNTEQAWHLNRLDQTTGQKTTLYTSPLYTTLTGEAHHSH